MTAVLKRFGWTSALVFLIALATAVAAGAQTGGTITGVVRDEQGQRARRRARHDRPDWTARAGASDTTTDERGAFVQTGLAPGNYRVSAFKGRFVTRRVRSARARRADRPRQLRARGGRRRAGRGDLVADDRAAPRVRGRRVRGGRRATRTPRSRNSTKRSTLDPRCTDCYYNLGIAFAQKKAYEDAEAAFRKAIELKPDFPDARHSLANALYNRGVTEWNAGRVPAARQRFEAGGRGATPSTPRRTIGSA